MATRKKNNLFLIGLLISLARLTAIQILKNFEAQFFKGRKKTDQQPIFSSSG